MTEHSKKMKIPFWLCVSLFACTISLLYAHRVLGPWEYHINVETGHLKEMMGDLYPSWVGARELLLHGRNPYGMEVSHEIQMAYYGHPIIQKYEPGVPVLDEQRFAYPVYALFFCLRLFILILLPCKFALKLFWQ